jgi:hypothetical protein
VNSAVTPLLDRRAPLPAVIESPVLLNPIVRAVVLTIGVGLLLLAVQTPLAGPVRAWAAPQLAQMFPARPWTAMDVLGIAVSIAVATVVIVAIHEIGHAVAGAAAGLRVSGLRVGPLQLDHRFRISRYRGPVAWSWGAASLVPVTTSHLRARAVAAILGGPAANLLSAWLCLAVPATPWVRLFIAGSVIGALVDLLPCRTGIMAFDGWYLMKAMTRGWAERWLAFKRLDAEIASGHPPESWPGDFLAAATALEDDSADTVRAHGLAHAAFDARGDWDAAARALEVCLRYCSRVAPLHRDLLISDAAVFQGRRQGRANLAQEWLDLLPRSPAFPAMRSRAEAAVLQARGDRSGALAKLSAAESELRAIPVVTVRDAALREVSHWMADLEESGPRGAKKGAECR